MQIVDMSLTPLIDSNGLNIEPLVGIVGIMAAILWALYLISKTHAQENLGTINESQFEIKPFSNPYQEEEVVEQYPQTLPCEICQSVMDFVSIEAGYSCRNKNCSLHIEDADEEYFTIDGRIIAIEPKSTTAAIRKLKEINARTRKLCDEVLAAHPDSKGVFDV